MAKASVAETSESLDFDTFRNTVLQDFRLANISREASLLGRKEVLTGKAKFGIFGDGKELAQIALAKQFRDGDFRSGYYRDQTIMLAIGQLNIEQYFAGLYAHTDVDIEPQSAGRQMGGHYSTRNLDKDGEWIDLMKQKNSSSDISPTAGQMPRLLGLAQASKIYRNNATLQEIERFKKFSNKGNEVAFGTIGDASTSEGPFWETINAAGVLQVPMVMSVWDDGYGISVPREFQTTKGSISEALAGMQRTKDKSGYEIFVTKGWDYAHLCETYEKAVKLAREEHVPVLVHVKEVNQPQGHSTSGSHERYKSPERLQWENDFDCIQKFKEWILSFNAGDQQLASSEELDQIQKEAKEHVRESKSKAWKAFSDDIKQELKEAIALIKKAAEESPNGVFILKEAEALENTFEPIRKDVMSAARKVLRMLREETTASKAALSHWIQSVQQKNHDRYSSLLHSDSKHAALKIRAVAPEYDGSNRQEETQEKLAE